MGDSLRHVSLISISCEDDRGINEQAARKQNPGHASFPLLGRAFLALWVAAGGQPAGPMGAKESQRQDCLRSEFGLVCQWRRTVRSFPVAISRQQISRQPGKRGLHDFSRVDVRAESFLSWVTDSDSGDSSNVQCLQKNKVQHNCTFPTKQDDLTLDGNEHTSHQKEVDTAFKYCHWKHRFAHHWRADGVSPHNKLSVHTVSWRSSVRTLRSSFSWQNKGHGS